MKLTEREDKLLRECTSKVYTTHNRIVDMLIEEEASAKQLYKAIQSLNRALDKIGIVWWERYRLGSCEPKKEEK